ncbi:LLM class F420-dependent oxidoreductase [Amycolatopsis vancoresmycina]|uniref:N5,N10-methylenetetrahydromethanopterin reductase-related protein n=1 Tax=Amycolatopsis vancoresmycina DSM 44592 TaxID=1292037 RepID=R1HM14_9PSEU|nr:LLM class F420-dependent oxidoreductase [Amycolatopsis vancoresmycina]EOD61421.1 N5,N10-methylenetetrahydromethanopterin reductase-related protein [Amycolatopsis vancoresmycina DSM 44592]
MKFGISTFVTDEGIRPDVLGAALEERGFDSLWLAEHSHIPASRETPYPGGGDLPRVYYRTLDPFVALTAAATATSELRLGTGIALLIQRDLIHTAKEVASLDLISDGRALFGVGVGWNREEMRNHGTDPKTRGALMDEQLAALKEIWTSEQAEFHGAHVDFDPIFSWPKPVQQPHVPIYIGGESEAALNRLVKYGDGWLLRGYTKYQEAQRVRRWLAEQGREDVQFAVFGGPTTPKVIDGFREAGVERYTFLLDTLPEAETLKALDELAKVAAAHR